MKKYFYERLLMVSFFVFAAFLVFFIYISYQGILHQVELNRKEKIARELLTSTECIVDNVRVGSDTEADYRQQLEHFKSFGLQYAHDSASVMQLAELADGNLINRNRAVTGRGNNSDFDRRLVFDSVFTARNKIVSAQQAAIEQYDVLEIENGRYIFVAIGISSLIALLIFTVFSVTLKKNIEKRIFAEDALLKANELLLDKVDVRTRELEHANTINTQIFEQTSDGFITLDSELNCTFINRKACEILKCEVSDVWGKKISTIVPEGVGLPFYNALLEAIEKNESVAIEDYYQPLDIWIDCHIYSSDNGHLIFFKDTSAHKKAERALVVERNLSESIISGLPGVFTMFDSNQRIVRWNKNSEVVSGFTPDEIRNMNPLDFLDQDERDVLQNLQQEIFERGYGEVETNFVNKKGEKTPYYFRGYISQIEGEPFFMGWGFDISERKKAEQLAVNEQNLNESIINSLPGIFYLDDEHGNVIRWNKNAEQITGYTELEAGKMNALEFLAEEDRPLLIEKIKETFETGTSELEAHLLTKTGQKLPYYFNGNAAMFNGRKHLIGIGIDISARQKAERDLLESEQKYRILFYNNPLPMFMLSLPAYTFADVNDAALKLYGYTHKEFLQMNVFDVRIPEEQERFEKDVRPRTLKGTSFLGKWTHKKKNGEKFLVDIITHDMDFGGHPVRLVLVNDISEREQAFEKVRQSEERLRHTMDNMLEGAQIVGFDWRFIYVNDAAVKQSMYSREELIGYNWLEKFPGMGTSTTYKALQKCMSERVSQHFINEFTFPDGSSGWFELSVQPIPEGIFILSVDISERKKAEDDLRKIVSELSDYKFALDQSAIVAITNQKGIITYANDNFCKVSKYKREELLGEDHRILNSGYHSKEFMRAMWVTIAEGKIWKGEIKNKAKDGSYYWVDTTIVPFLSASGKPYQYLAIRKEITERKKAEEELVLSEAKLKDAQTLAHIGSFDMNLATGVVEWSDEMFNLLGFKKGEVVASVKLFISMVHPEELVEVKRVVAESSKKFGNATTTLRLINRKGFVCYCFCEWKFEFDHLQQPLRVYGFVQDITDQKENEEKIQGLNKKLITANDQLEIILNTLPANIALLDGDGKIVAVNKAWQSFAQTNNMQGDHYGVGDNYIEVCEQAKGDDEPVALKMAEGIKKVLSGELEEAALEYPCHSPEEERWFRVEVRPLRENVKAGAVIMHVSITERMKAEMAIIEMNSQLEQKVMDRTMELTEANKALEAFSYSVSHDLKAPVRAVNGFVRIIQKEYGAGFTPDLQELFEHIDSSGRRMSAIIDDMLTLAKYDKVKIKPAKVDMAQLFSNVWDNIYFAAPHRASVKFADLPVVDGDSSMLEQVVVNLLSNAIKYSSKKEKPQISIGCQRTEGAATFFIKDNGAGFDMKNYDRLFGAFQRLHGSSEFEGTGVGLLLVKRIIEKHGGIVWAEGKVNEGATFYFTLPLVQP